MRLNKYIAESGFASRRKAEEYIEQGRVLINGKVVTNLATQVNPFSDEVYVDDVKLKIKEKLYFLLNKPKGFITSTSDEKNRKTVVDLINTREKIFPVGRLDYNTTGVLLLTNDGELANKITHPKNNFKRVYVAKIDKELSALDKDKLLTGVYFDKRKGVFTELSYVKERNFKIVKVSVVEGRNHFVKKMFSTLGYRVVELDRESFGGITVKGLRPGEYKILTHKEIEKLIQK
ncbi:MAG: rRNA pseudouridine synthase [Bacteroidetes bacterium]|nr:rRNA pseudouridine synthase [Bacteroidota bacterium]MBU1113658.1 rRNA pseudouridine synthase [Bacteroidota bacterium]MBU1796766.1 rRNA pseudouridine synthase [Bacteroidota bacterium]